VQLKKAANLGISLIIGIIIGMVVTIDLFSIDIDVLAIPYINQGIKFTESIIVEQDGTGAKLSIPKGTELLLERRMPEGEVYTIRIYSYDIGSVVHTEFIEKKPIPFTVKGSNVEAH